MNTNGEVISIGRYLRSMNSSCHYSDFFRVFKARHPGKEALWVNRGMERRLRKLRERGVFFTPHGMQGQFFIADKLRRCANGQQDNKQG